MTKHFGKSRFSVRGLAVVGAALLGAVSLALAANSPEAEGAKPNRYIGAAKCMNCHSSEVGGDQYGAWMAAKHSAAWEVLGTDEAKLVAKELGIADPQASDQCIRCHVTGHGEPAELFKKGFDIKKGVQCETCHGPGEQHMRARFRAAAEEEDVPEGEVPPYVKVPDGEIITTPPKQTCYACHNAEAPTFKAFCYYERVTKIRHLDPRKPRTEEQLAAMLVCGCGDACGCVHECADEACAVPPKK